MVRGSLGVNLSVLQTVSQLLLHLLRTRSFLRKVARVVPRFADWLTTVQAQYNYDRREGGYDSCAHNNVPLLVVPMVATRGASGHSL